MISSNLWPPATHNHRDATTARSARSTATLHIRTERRRSPHTNTNDTVLGFKKNPIWLANSDQSRESTAISPSLPKKRVYYRVNSVRQSGHVNLDESMTREFDNHGLNKLKVIEWLYIKPTVITSLWIVLLKEVF